MHRILAYFLTALLLFQTLGQELLVVQYELNKERITALFCVNKARPQLRCNGQCHLAQQLRKIEGEGANKKAPVSKMGKMKFEVLPASARPAFRAPRHWPSAAWPYAARPAARYVDAPAPGVFRPPLLAA
ncbi:hypothetical protein [Hymenobacter sp.]|uniref:hypothetical protein n=1 Tax=Hymenobacter sp. TaxID=1898978 RepID=UPI00286C8C90|nr:hypothetical protein [Hymenobacter sp.]